MAAFRGWPERIHYTDRGDRQYYAAKISDENNRPGEFSQLGSRAFRLAEISDLSQSQGAAAAGVYCVQTHLGDRPSQ